MPYTFSTTVCPAKDVVCFKCQKKGHFQAHQCIGQRIDREDKPDEVVKKKNPVEE